jgi:NADH-quinone oxidoreductase subunit D
VRARLHAAYSPWRCGCTKTRPLALLKILRRGQTQFMTKFMVDVDGLPTENRIFKQRNVDIGNINEQDIP